MARQMQQYMNEIISIFMMLMLFLALASSPAEPNAKDEARPVSVSVKQASKVATEPLRRPTDGGRRLLD
jgi:hypothetical protein